MQRDGQPDKAREAFRALRADTLNTALHDLATIREARLSDDDAAIELLTATLLAPSSKRLATRARLELIRIALGKNDAATASHHLLNTPWDEVAMPELANLSFLSFQVGDLLLETDPSNALAAYRLVSPVQQLLAMQRERIAQLEDAITKRAPLLKPEHNLWSDFYKEVLASLRAQLTILEDGPDYADTLSYRKALCFAQLSRPLEAWMLLERLSLVATGEMAPIAHLKWITVARQMEAWNASAAIAREYIELYPDRTDADQALYWIAQSQIDAGEALAAIETLQLLLLRTADPAIQASSHYFIGYCQSVSGRNAAAIESFRRAIELRPDRPIAAQASLWIGICQFAQEEYDSAARTFQELGAQPAWSFIHAEASYREAAALYANSDYEPALDKISSWLEEYAGHAREPEAHMLHGDLLRDAGRLREASAAYQKVDAELRELRFFALSNFVEIQLELGATDHARRALEHYATDPIPAEFVGSFFAQWAHCLTLDGKAEQAATKIEKAIVEYGNRPEAQGIMQLIEAAAGADTRALEERIAQTASSDQHTLASRYTLAIATALESAKRTADSQRYKLRLVSDYDRNALPPECLVAAGFALLDIGSIDASSFLDESIGSYPESDYSQLALFGLARDAAARGDNALALSRLALVEHGYLSTTDLSAALDLQGELQLQSGLLEAAKSSYEALLAHRQASARFKAKALFSLGTIQLRIGDSPSAYAYFQRIFTLYRSERDLVADAYLNCIQILATEGRHAESVKVCEELLAQPDLAKEAAYAKALPLFDQLRAQLEDETIATH